MTPAPKLSPPQQEVVHHRGAHLQVIACAGSGKTESISQRIAGLIQQGAIPESIVAFTFTERAAAELKERIISRTAELCGEAIKGSLARMYVGTIHGYCFKLLQDHVPSFGNYDVLDEHRHAGLLSRESNRLKLKQRLSADAHWKPIQSWIETVDVIGNELIPRSKLEGHILGELYDDYIATLDHYHFLTFALIIQKAVEALQDPKVFASVHGPLRYLVVDEYQDINPAQEALIRRLGTAPVQVCVVGDDDQAIYQWRGSDVANIQRFTTTFPGAVTKPLLENRRSKKEIVDLAERFAQTIPVRLAKKMQPMRESSTDSVVPWSAENPEEEAATIAATIARLKARGYHYRDIGILFRSVRTSAQVLVEALRARGIPFACGGRTGLFLQPEVECLGRTYVWLAGWEWKPPGYGQAPVHDTLETLVDHYRAVFGNVQPAKVIRATLEGWERLVDVTDKPVNLIRDFYNLLQTLRIHELDPDDDVSSSRLGALARFSNILADFENITRRGRWLTKEDGTTEFTGGTDRGKPYFERLANYLLHYARDAYEDFEGEAAPDLDAVDIVTVHQAKGLEWPIVFIPSLSALRFPSKNAGKSRDWLLPDSAFGAAARRRYEGGEDDERRLFYVAITRARDALYLSHFRRQKNRARISPFLADLFSVAELPDRTDLPLPPPLAAEKQVEKPRIAISFSELSDFDECGFRFRLSTSFGFETQLVSELGYGRAIHHVLRAVAEVARTEKRIPKEQEVEAILDAEFYLPFANKGNFENMRKMASRLVRKYVTAYAADLQRIWATERSFEMHLADGTLSGRADVILDRHEGKPDALAIVDYKTSKGHDQDATFAFQLSVYAAAGRAEGLDVQAAYLHHLEESARTEVPVAPKDTAKAVAKVESLVRDLREARFVPKPEKKRCEPCEYRRLCRHAPASPWDED
jgi:DNA helicase-2/ATP-dependent DNA helicase PcrA